jgi:hypothetical protein
MSHNNACLAITAPPPEAEAALATTLRHLFPALEPAMLTPFFDVGDTLYLSSADRPSLGHVAHALRTAGHPVEPCDPPADLHTERSLVMPHPEAGDHPDRRTVVMLGRRRLAVDKAVAITVPFQEDPRELDSYAPGGPRCPRCHENLLKDVPFCPNCGNEPPAGPAVPHRLEIRLPDDQRRHRVLSWLAQATGRTIPQLRPGAGHDVSVQVTLPPDAAAGLVRHLAGWGAVAVAETESGPVPPIRLGPRDAGIGFGVMVLSAVTSLPHTLGVGFWALALAGWAYTHREEWQVWRSGGVPTLDPVAATRLSGPLPADLLADVQACLTEVAGSGLQPVVRRTLTITAGIFGAMGAADAVSQHLWQDLEPELRSVVSGILSLVRRGRQLELFLHDHGAAAVEHEVRRLERLLERTTDAVSRGHYEQALASAQKTRQRRQDALLAAERLGSQLLVLLHGLADVQATVAMSSLSVSDASPLVAQVQRLQKDVAAADEALRELLG